MKLVLTMVLLSIMTLPLFANPTKDTEEREITRQNVTWKEANPRRIKADSLYYIRLGYGGTMGSDLGGNGAAFGFGYRYETDMFAVDVSFLNTVLSIGDDENGADMDFLRLGGIYFLNPVSDHSLYFGLGLSYGGTLINPGGEDESGDDEDSKWNVGLRANPSVGFEMMRTSTVRLFLQIDAVLPFYQSSNNSGDDEEYTPSVYGTVGIGW